MGSIVFPPTAKNHPFAIQVSPHFYHHISPSFFFRNLNDGLTHGWVQTQLQVPLLNETLPIDIWTVHFWGLAHHGGVLTYVHHDTAGTGTFATVVSGVKVWLIIKVKNATRERLTELLACLCNPDNLLSSFPSDEIDIKVIYLYPRDHL